MKKRAPRSESEVWRSIRFYPGYQISSWGRVRSLKGKRPKLMKLQAAGRGDRKKKYLRITLRNKGGKKHRKIHRLVALTFIPRIAGKNTVNHINGSTKDNGVENLEWTTNAENVKHAWQTGLMKNVGQRRKSYA